MTTKYKIIGSFFIMTVLMFILAGIGWYSLQTASTNFTDYRRMAQLNIAGGRLEMQVKDIMSDIYEFSAYENNDAVEDALRKLEGYKALITEARSFSNLEYTHKILDKAQQDANSLETGIAAIRDNLAGVLQHYGQEVEPSVKALGTLLGELAVKAADNVNPSLTPPLVAAQNAFTELRVALNRLAETKTESAANAVNDTAGLLSASVAALEPAAANFNERELIGKIKSSLAGTQTSIKAMQSNCLALSSAVAQVEKLSSTMETDVRTLDEFLAEARQKQGAGSLESNLDSQRSLLVLSAIGILLGALLAAVVVYLFIRVIKALASFCDSTANGDFSQEVTIKERGEIGSVVDSVQHVSIVLKQILTEYRTLESTIGAGTLQASVDTAAFKGEFATLMQGTNRILKRFTTVLDNIPSPVVMLDSSLHACYMNDAAQTIAGSDYLGKTCKELFDRDDFGTPDCALARAVQSGQPKNGETCAHPLNKTLDITYTAVPMMDADGKLASVLQLITDISHIKNTQRTIVETANQAAEISNRVAAASEELSTQVEQISYGAAQQRERVESTASAMMEMNATVLEVARSAGQASEQTEVTRDKADSGAGLVNRVVQSINMVNTVAETLQGNMQELGTQAESIGGVMNVISDIADQTNLLALNAAIEAARAGEAGRGFAVVADEVRKLAEKTMEATHEVGSSIQAIQASARNNINEVGSAVKSIHEATGLANSSGAALQEIVELAAANSSVVASIATAAEEQSATSEEINSALDEINKIVGETAEGMVQSTSAIQELSEMAQQLREVMERLK